MSKEDAVMIGAKENQDHTELNIMWPCEFGALLCITTIEILSLLQGE